MQPTPDSCTSLRTILVADDNAASRELIRAAFEPRGFHVIEASDGIEAARAVIECAPDVAFVDIRMPLVEGTAVVEYVRRLNPAAKTHMIAFTALPAESDWRHMVAAGFDDYVAKPTSVDQLRRLVEKVAPAKKRGESLHAWPVA